MINEIDVNLVNKIVFEGIVLNGAEESMKSNMPSTLTWKTPPGGNSPGKDVTTKLRAGRATGKNYPLNEVNSDLSFEGFPWSDEDKQIQLNAVLKKKYGKKVTISWERLNAMADTLSILVQAGGVPVGGR